MNYQSLRLVAIFFMTIFYRRQKPCPLPGFRFCLNNIFYLIFFKTSNTKLFQITLVNLYILFQGLPFQITYDFERHIKYKNRWIENLTSCVKIRPEYNCHLFQNRFKVTEPNIEYIFYVQTGLVTEGKLSWENASSICEQAGGVLPYFTSNDDIHRLIALLKQMINLPRIQAIFIGLKTNAEEVGNTYVLDLCLLPVYVVHVCLINI